MTKKNVMVTGNGAETPQSPLRRITKTQPPVSPDDNPIIDVLKKLIESNNQHEEAIKKLGEQNLELAKIIQDTRSNINTVAHAVSQERNEPAKGNGGILDVIREIFNSPLAKQVGEALTTPEKQVDPYVEMAKDLAPKMKEDFLSSLDFNKKLRDLQLQEGAAKIKNMSNGWDDRG